MTERYYYLVSAASRVVGTPRPMPLLGGRLMLEDQAEQEMHVAAVGSAFRRLGSIGSPHLAQVPYVPLSGPDQLSSDYRTTWVTTVKKYKCDDSWIKVKETTS